MNYAVRIKVRIFLSSSSSGHFFVTHFSTRKYGIFCSFLSTFKVHHLQQGRAGTLGGPFGPFLGVVGVVMGCGMTGLDGPKMWVWGPGQKMGSPGYAGYPGFDGNRLRVYGLVILVGHVMQ